MTYTADMNHVHMLESGNWFTGFVANTKTRTVSFTYHDRRRAGQVARHYTIKFKADLSTVEDIVAVSAQAGRVEHFKSTVARETCANIIRRAKMVDFEESLEQNEQATQDNEKPMTAVVVETFVDKMGTVASVFAVIGFIVTLVYFLFGDASLVEVVLYSLIGAELGCLIALIAGSFAMDVKHRK